MPRIETGMPPAMQVTVNASRPDKAADIRSQAASSAQQPGGNADATTLRVHADFTRFQSINDQQNQVASQIRNDDRQLNESGQHLGRMKRMLFHIVKNYPPYPPGEPERVKFLRTFNGLRQQIELMTIPPEKKWHGWMPGDPFPQSDNNQAGSAPNRTAAPTVPGAAPAFNIPELPDLAEDSDIEITVNLIDKAQAAIVNRRSNMAEQASGINQSVGYGAKAAELNRTSLEPWDLVLPAEDEAEQKSIEAGSGLERALGSSITQADMQPLLQKLAG